MDRIKIEGYKSIRETTVNIGAINILIGGNGAGKSNFTSFFTFLSSLYQERLSIDTNFNGGAQRVLYHGGFDNAESIKCAISFNNEKNAYTFEILASGNHFYFTSEILYYRGEPFNITSNGPETNINNTTIRRADYIRTYLSQLKVYHFHDTGKDSPFAKASNVATDQFYLYSRGENLAAFLVGLQLKNDKAYKRIVKTIQSIAPFFQDFFLPVNDNGFTNLFWRDRYSEYVYGVRDLSDGTIRFIALSTLFLQPQLPQVIIIDEPELGLHPVAITKLAGLIQQAANRGTKVIVATQSTALLSCFSADNIITVDNIDGASHFNRLNPEDLDQWLEDYTLGDLWSRNIIEGGQP